MYRDPLTLPDSASAAVLSSEAHSFSRVFTAGFFEALAGMLATRTATPTEADLLSAATDMGRLLVDALPAAPVVPQYYSQVAAHMIESDARLFQGKYRDALKGAFVRHGILSLQAATALTGPQVALAERRGVVGAAGERAAAESLPQVAISGADYGLGAQHILVQAPAEPQRFQAAAAALGAGSLTGPTPEQVARSFLEHLLRRGRIDVGRRGEAAAVVSQPSARKTHELVEQDGGLALVRRLFDGGIV